MTTTPVPECQTHKGFYDLGGYYHAKRLQNGTFSLYEGCWASNRCGVGYLSASKDDNDKPRRFATLDDASNWIEEGRTP